MDTATATATTEQLPSTIEIEGSHYEVEPATISEAYIGYETHGILIANLSFEGPGWGQREPAYNRTPQDLDRYLRGVLTVTKASDWSRVADTPVFALRKNLMGAIEGFISEDQKRILFFDGGRSSKVIFRD